MTALTALITRFCAGEDNWLARKRNSASDPGTSEMQDGNGKPRRTKHNNRNNNERLCETTANAGFHNPKPGQRKKPLKSNQDEPSTLDRISDRPCQIHGHPDKPASHTNRNYWVFKQAGKLNAEHNGRRPPGDKDDGAARYRTPGARNSFPLKFDHSRNGNSSSASATHLLYWQDLHHAYITTHSRYHGHRRKHNTDNPASIPVTFLSVFLIFLYHLLRTGDQ